jgi:hypothetical protein
MNLLVTSVDEARDERAGDNCTDRNRPVHNPTTAATNLTDKGSTAGATLKMLVVAGNFVLSAYAYCSVHISYSPFVFRYMVLSFLHLKCHV